MADHPDEPVLTIKLKKGLADRNRLPLSHVLSVLEEFGQMIADVGKLIQRERGAADQSGDFGLELLATNGSLLKKGSVQAPIAITNNVSVGVLAAREVVRILGTLEQEDGVPAPAATLNKDVIRRVARVARIQKADKMEVEVSLHRAGFTEPVTATFGNAGMASLKALQSPTFEVEGTTVYGKLVELIDRDQAEEDGKGFWGALRKEDGESWRVQFRPADLEKVTPLFRKQVAIFGKAVYYRAASPKIIVDTIGLDSERDYEAAFDELYGCYREAFATDTKTLLKRLREE